MSGQESSPAKSPASQPHPQPVSYIQTRANGMISGCDRQLCQPTSQPFRMPNCFPQGSGACRAPKVRSPAASSHSARDKSPAIARKPSSRAPETGPESLKPASPPADRQRQGPQAPRQMPPASDMPLHRRERNEKAPKPALRGFSALAVSEGFKIGTDTARSRSAAPHPAPDTCADRPARPAPASDRNCRARRCRSAPVRQRAG